MSLIDGLGTLVSEFTTLAPPLAVTAPRKKSLPAPIANWDAQKITGVADGTRITAWSDSSGNGHNLTCAANGPTYHNAGATLIGGHPVVVHAIQSANETSPGTSSALALTQPFTIGAVCAHVSQAGETAWYVCSEATTDNAAIFLESGAPAGYAIFSGTTLGDAAGVTTSPVIIVGVFNGASSVIARNNTPTSGNAGTHGTTGTYVVGALGTATGNFSFTGSIGQVIIYPGAFTVAQRTTLYQNLKAHWSL